LRPFGLAVLREVAPPSFSGFCVLVITLEQECKVEHRISASAALSTAQVSPWHSR